MKTRSDISNQSKVNTTYWQKKNNNKKKKNNAGLNFHADCVSVQEIDRLIPYILVTHNLVEYSLVTKSGF